ncbi:acyl-CoA N-acyltransferase [Cadophora sp. DSE1049]|nr:acyl-CoA N-acyltransferase [Cadophora sp. DSE1049]
MPPANIAFQLAAEDDAPVLASIMTAAFSTSDAAYPLIWGSAPEGTHDTMSIVGLFSPVQKPDRVTYKAVDEDTKMVVGFATWGLPKVLPKSEDGKAKKEEDLSFCFVHPQYQRQGIASSLLGIGSREAEERKARFWCTSTPQAVSTYEKNGWKIVETHDVDLGKYGGEGIYTRSWMVREPKSID